MPSALGKMPFCFYGAKRQMNLYYRSPTKHYPHDPAIYSIAAIIAFFGAAYAISPVYKLLCQPSGVGGIAKLDDYSSIQYLLSLFKLNAPGQGASHGEGKTIPTPPEDISQQRPIKVTFMTTIGPLLPWKFVPTQRSVYVRPGETALAFFTASNLSPTKDITGISTYSVAPHAAAPFLTKIQCFCFEQQRLAAGETVDMPVYFYIDPEIRDGHYSLKNLDEITLSYSFFAADK